VTRGTVVGWAPQRDTDSARMRWWVTAGSVLPGARRGQAESRPPRLRMALGALRCGWREVVRAALVQGDESGNVLPLHPAFADAADPRRVLDSQRPRGTQSPRAPTGPEPPPLKHRSLPA